MEPREVDLQKIALHDPIAAYGLFLGVPITPYSFSISATFPTLAIPDMTTTPPTVNAQVVEADMDVASQLAQRTWIDNVTYALRLPNAFTFNGDRVPPGNIFKPQFDAYLKQSPGIDVQLQVLGGPKYFLSVDPVPLENVIDLICTPRWPAGMPLYKNQAIRGFFTLVQSPGGLPPGTATGGPPGQTGPYTVIMTFNCWQFLDVSVDAIDVRTAIRKLREAGFCIPQIHCPDPRG